MHMQCRKKGKPNMNLNMLFFVASLDIIFLLIIILDCVLYLFYDVSNKIREKKNFILVSNYSCTQLHLKHTTSCHQQAWKSSNLRCDQNSIWCLSVSKWTVLVRTPHSRGWIQHFSGRLPFSTLSQLCCWSTPQLNDLVPLMNRSACLRVRVLMRGPKHFPLSLIKSRWVKMVKWRCSLYLYSPKGLCPFHL